MIWRVRACITGRETHTNIHREQWIYLRSVLENCVSPCGAPTNFGAAPTAMWFYSSTDGDGRLQRLRRVLRVGSQRLVGCA